MHVIQTILWEERVLRLDRLMAAFLALLLNRVAFAALIIVVLLSSRKDLLKFLVDRFLVINMFI